MGGGNTPQEFHAMVMDQIDKVEKIVKSLKLEPQ
jgi:hypothetical protein